MSSVIKVKGMHCEACKKLIQMEIEDDETLKKKLVKVSLIDSDKEIGEVEMKDLTETELGRLKSLINVISEYEVVEE